jgi:hypothetical protein
MKLGLEGLGFRQLSPVAPRCVPSLWPPRVPTAYTVDLRHGNFDFQENGKVITIDGLIM